MTCFWKGRAYRSPLRGDPPPAAPLRYAGKENLHRLLVFERAVRHESERTFRIVVVAEKQLVMQMQRHRIAGGVAHQPDLIARMHVAANGKPAMKTGKVSVARVDAVAMVDQHHVSVIVAEFHLEDGAVRRGEDRPAGTVIKVDPLVQMAVTAAETGGEARDLDRIDRDHDAVHVHEGREIGDAPVLFGGGRIGDRHARTERNIGFESATARDGSSCRSCNRRSLCWCRRRGGRSFCTGLRRRVCGSGTIDEAGGIHCSASSAARVSASVTCSTVTTRPACAARWIASPDRRSAWSLPMRDWMSSQLCPAIARSPCARCTSAAGLTFAMSEAGAG